MRLRYQKFERCAGELFDKNGWNGLETVRFRFVWQALLLRTVATSSYMYSISAVTHSMAHGWLIAILFLLLFSLMCFHSLTTRLTWSVQKRPVLVVMTRPRM